MIFLIVRRILTKKFLFVFLVVLLLIPSVYAADYDTYYEVEPVVSSGSESLLSMALTSTASTRDLSDSESRYLTDIRNAMVAGYSNYTSSSVLGLLYSIRSNTNNSSNWSSLLSDVGYIESDTTNMVATLDAINSKIQSYLSNLSLLSDINTDTDSLLDYCRSYLPQLDYLSSVDSHLSSFYDLFSRVYFFNMRAGDGSVFQVGNYPLQLLTNLSIHATRNGIDNATGKKTLYSVIEQLQMVLASDDDLDLANSQKENREEIEDSFLSGESGSTSLGASDFGALSDLGGTVKDTISLNGQSSMTGFTDGLSGANTAGQGWFSEETKNALDSVSAASTYNMRSDPYNMAGWQERYAWVEGE